MHKEQLRAARALVGWTQEEMASISGVALPTIKRIESGRGPLVASADVLDKILGALSRAGIEILGSDDSGGFGVRIIAMDETDRLLRCYDHLREALAAARQSLTYADIEALQVTINTAIKELTSAETIILRKTNEDIPDIPE